MSSGVGGGGAEVPHTVTVSPVEVLPIPEALEGTTRYTTAGILHASGKTIFAF